jgi:hypothetical protein
MENVGLEGSLMKLKEAIRTVGIGLTMLAPAMFLSGCGSDFEQLYAGPLFHKIKLLL